MEVFLYATTADDPGTAHPSPWRQQLRRRADHFVALDARAVQSAWAFFFALISFSKNTRGREVPDMNQRGRLNQSPTELQIFRWC